MNRDEDPGPLPSIETTECMVRNMSAQGFREHLRHFHKITIGEFEELFNDVYTNKLIEMEYETRLKQMQLGFVPDPLPMIDICDCRMCGPSVGTSTTMKLLNS